MEPLKQTKNRTEIPNVTWCMWYSVSSARLSFKGGLMLGLQTIWKEIV